jgi:two-component system chemotaxis response regulator CheY
VVGVGQTHRNSGVIRVIEILHKFNQARFLTFVPEIRKNTGDWQLIEVSLTHKTEHNIPFIARKLGEHFAQQEGILFICNNRQILAVVRMGANTDSSKVSAGINGALPQYSCSVEASEITADGLLKFQVRLQGMEEESRAQAVPHLLDARQRRVERIVMVADDDMFMRSLISKTFLPKVKVIELAEAATVVDAYLEHLPDALFLDIHLPGGSGIDILADLLKFDETAYVAILTSDRVKENVISAKKTGAKAFIAKPFTRQKLEEFYNLSPSVAPWIAAKKP